MKPIEQPRGYALALKGVFFLSLLVSGSVMAAAPVVLEPFGNNNRVPAGHDFATQELGDPWDMDRLEDIFTPKSIQLANETVSNGIYNFDTIEEDLVGITRGQFWLIYQGIENTQRLVSEDRNPVTGRRLFTREKFPIDPNIYRYFTARVRMTSATAQPLEGTQPLVVYYFEDSTSIGKGLYGNSTAFRVPPNEWTIVNIDLAAEVDPNGPENWSLLPQVEGLRVDPTTNPGVHVEVDWVRLTTEPAPEEFFTVTWNGNGASDYAVSARSEVAVDAVAFELASGVSGTSADVRLGKLPPGEYRIEVSGAGETGLSPGTVSVNDVPLINFTMPNIKGEQSLGYGAVVNSNPWSEIDPDDVELVLGFESYSYTNPAGSLTGRPEADSSRVLMNTPVPIDTSYYRMLCFEVEIMGPRDIGTGSVTKVLWGNVRSKLTTPSPVIPHDGLNEYCVGDMADLRIDPFSPEGAEDAWIGAIDHIRFDPHEFPRSAECNSNPSPEVCRDIRFDSMVLAPFHRANPGFTFRWNDFDSDDDALVEIWLDDDKVPGNTPGSTEHLVGSLSENLAGNKLDWTVPDNVADGLWNVYAVIDDGLNSTIRYAGGPLLIGEPPVAMVKVVNPDGVRDEVISGAEYGLDDRKDQWDMDNDDLNLSLVQNTNGASLSGGLFTGTAVDNNPQFILMTTNDGDPAINPAEYRYLTIKMRATDVVGPHFVQVFYSSDPGAPRLASGFTNGIPIFEDIWSWVTFDLNTDINPISEFSWTNLSTVRSIRIDPTTKPGTRFEIDWVTLSASPTVATDFDIQWSAANTGFSTFDVNLVDSLGHRLNLATDLSSATRSYTINLSTFILGQYYAEIVAKPGPIAVSTGAISLILQSQSADHIFKDGFE